MSESLATTGFKQKKYGPSSTPAETPTSVYCGFWLLLLFGTLFSSGPWAGYDAVLLGGAALLMFLFPPKVSLPRIWWVFAGLFVILSMGAFLPAAWFPAPEWRGKLVALGLDAGSQVVIQSRMAAEILFLYVATLLTGMWLAGHRPSPQQVRVWALMFTSGVAAYAVLSMIRYDSASGGVFGFFRNRNHTATYLAMGSVCGLGCILQALRDKRFVSMGVSLVMTSICLWAVAGWSISRAGILLVVLGSLIWVSLLGRKYLGKHGTRALGLIALAAVGFFFIADTTVKERIAKSVEKAKAISADSEGPAFSPGKQDANTFMDFDFRVPIAIETVNLIKDFKLTGVGAGQFKYVFPQYRRQTAVANNTQALHPESDWLLIAAETGIPATLGFLILVVCAFWRALQGVWQGKDRALRAGCLIAALIVPLHGIFDVPGHRMALAWSSAFLFALSLHIPSGERSERPLWRSGAFRGIALLMMIAATVLARAQWWNGPQPAYTAARTALPKAWKAQYDETILRQNISPEELDARSESEDPLSTAIEALHEVRKVTPLDGDVLYTIGYNSLFYEVPLEITDQAFTLQRALDPTWIDAPLRQAHALMNTGPTQTASLWGEAVRRAKYMNSIHPDKKWQISTMNRIRAMAKNRPEFDHLLPKFE